MKSLAVITMTMTLGLSGRHSHWDEDFVIEKSNLPKRDKLPLTEDEKCKLSELSGKAKKQYLIELRNKYES